MRLARRWVEISVLLIGILCLWNGIHLPPPIAGTVTTTGVVYGVVASPAGLEFSVAKKRFSASPFDFNYRGLRREIVAGREVTIEGWSWGGWPSDDHLAVLEVSTGGTPVISRSRHLATYWLACTLLIGMGSGLVALAVTRLRNERPISEIVREKELRQAVAAPLPKERERLFGLALFSMGLAGVFGPIVIGSSFYLPVVLRAILALLPIASLFPTIVGAHRLIFGRPLTVHDAPARRIGFGSGVGCLTLLAAAVVAAVLFDPR
jgi:hypothetical protein